MNIPPKFKKIFRIILSFLLIYIAWSAYVDLSGLDHEVDDEAIVPCLFFLPPVGILVIGIVLVKVIQSAIFIRVIKIIRSGFHKTKNSQPS